MVTQPASIQSVIIDELNAELLAAYTMLGQIRGSAAIAEITAECTDTQTAALSGLIRNINDHIAQFDSYVSALRAQRDSAPDPMEGIDPNEPIPYLPV